MKLYMVIFLAGRISSIIGPLPYGIEECQRQVTEQQKLAAEIFTPQGFRASEVKFICEWHSETDNITDR